MSRRALAVLPLVAALAGTGARAQPANTEPLWEAGAGVGALYFPDYRGSSHARFYVLPVPYVVYRGRELQADRRGLRGVFLDNDRLDLHVSVGASLPVSSSDNPVREGLPDLKPAVELGPALEVHVWRSRDAHMQLDLRMPLRGAVTVESRPQFIGWQFSPNLNLDVADPAGMKGWNLGMLSGPVYTDARYNRYFYEVPEAYATPGRPAYTPGGGYGGIESIVALSKRFPKFWVGAFARYDTLHDAAFESSPLVTSRHYFAAGIGVAWILGESTSRVPVTEMGVRQR